MKHAAYIGNDHLKIRVTPFFDTQAEAQQAAIDRNQPSAFIAPCANWEEHQRWNKQRIGMYKNWPVAE